MLRFVIEWEDEPRVQDRLLRATWARLEIHAGDGAQVSCLTECVAGRSNSLRRGVYGSVLPVAAWVVENWWSLLNETLRTDRFRSGRELANDPVLRPWVQRHSFLAARGGFALPDLTLFRDGGRVAARCVPDAFDVATPYPVRFVRDAEFRLCPTDAQDGLRVLVESVADRVRELAPDEPQTGELLENWEAVQESARTEEAASTVAAAMGVDPYDPGQLTEELLAILEGPFRLLPAALRWDLAEATERQTVSTDLGWVLAAGAASELRHPHAAFSGAPADSGATAAHVAGYELARSFIDRFGTPPAHDLEGFVLDRCGWAPSLEPLLQADGVANRINALVGPDQNGKLRLIPSAAPSRPESKRFLLGRALFFVPAESSPLLPRLLTRASSWSQRASRAFAAELLVPADALRRQVSSGQVSFEEVGDLAHQFLVSEMVIEHQLENHRIAHIV